MLTGGRIDVDWSSMTCMLQVQQCTTPVPSSQCPAQRQPVGVPQPCLMAWKRNLLTKLHVTSNMSDRWQYMYFKILISNNEAHNLQVIILNQ